MYLLFDIKLKGYNKEGGLNFCCESMNWGAVNRWGSMFNKQYGDASISKSLQLIVHIIQL